MRAFLRDLAWGKILTPEPQSEINSLPWEINDL